MQDSKGFHQFKRDSSTEEFPHRFSEYVSNFGEVYFWPKGNFHVVTRAALARNALTNPNLSCDRSPFFISRMPHMDLSLLGDFFSVVSKMMVMSDGQAHYQRRSTATVGLSDELLDGYAHKITPLLTKLIDGALVNGHLDFANDVASNIPSAILADLFCIPEADRPLFYERSGAMTAFFGGGTGYENEDGIRVNTAAKDLKTYFKDLMAERKKKPRHDFFSGMLRVADKFGMADDDLISQAIMMLVAGQVTTSDQINNVLYLLLKHPDILRQVHQDRSLIPAMIEEFSRMDPAVTFLFRVAKGDTLIGPQIIKKGDTVFIASHCINRDPEEFPDPHSARLNRPKILTHFTYGYGAHHCLGARLARMEMTKIFEALIERFPGMRLNGTAERNHYSLSFSGFKSLPVQLE